MKRICLAAAVLLATTTMTMALEKVQITYSGVVSVEHLADANGSANCFYGNGDVSFRWSSVNDLKFGVDLGLEKFSGLDDESFIFGTAYYAAGVVEGRFGKVSIGMPRGIMDDYFTVPGMGGTEFFNQYSELVVVGSDLIGSFDSIGSGTEEFYGARYDGKIGQIEVAASAFRWSGSAVHAEEIAARYDAGQWSVSLGTVLLDFEGISLSSTSLEVQGHAGKFSGGMVYTNSDLLNIDAIRGFVSYDVNEMIKLNTQVLHFDTGSSDNNFYSFDLSYKHKTGAFITAGVIKEASDNNLYNVSLGYKF